MPTTDVQRELKSWKNIFPEVFLLEFITDKLCVFELLLFGHFSILHNFAERPFVPFFFIIFISLEMCSDGFRCRRNYWRISEGSDSDPNGLVDSLKFLSLHTKRVAHATPSNRPTDRPTVEAEPTRRKSALATCQRPLFIASRNNGRLRRHFPKSEKFFFHALPTDTGAHHFSFDAKQKNAFLIRFMCRRHIYSAERRLHCFQPK